MQYRAFGKIDWKPSALGFGTMRLPVIDNKAGQIDEPEAIRMIRYAIDHGVNYVDTAYPYHEGKSEVLTGRALRDGYRERVHLVTKLPVWMAKSPDDCERLLNEQLRRLQTDHIDLYLMHSLDKNRWPNVQRFHILEWAEKARADGRIGHIGFSFHDRYPLFQQIIDSYDGWEFCQIQYNYLDHEYQAGTRGLKYAAAKGLGVVVMEPLRGGGLVKAPPKVNALWEAAPVHRSAAEWALDWVWNQPEVSLLLSGMSTFQQVVENVEYAGRSHPGMLSAQDLELIARARELYGAARLVPCTDCQYCQPCPNGVDIPRIFEMVNSGHMLDEAGRARFLYTLMSASEHADKCQECGECEEKCPQGISIIEELKKAQAYLTGQAA